MISACNSDARKAAVVSVVWVVLRVPVAMVVPAAQ